MFAQMKRKRSEFVCPCNNSCICHEPEPEHWFFSWWFALCLLFCLIVLIIFGCLFSKESKESKEHIFVGDKDCTIEFVETGCTSTGACSGYKKANCPK